MSADDNGDGDYDDDEEEESEGNPIPSLTATQSVITASSLFSDFCLMLCYTRTRRASILYATFSPQQTMTTHLDPLCISHPPLPTQPSSDSLFRK